MKSQNEKTEMSPLSKVMRKLQDDGYTHSFLIEENKLKLKEDNTRIYLPYQVNIVNFYRFEGESDPADSSILYAIETADGYKGLLTDAYGMYADENTSAFLQEVENIKKEKPTPKHSET